MSEELPIEEAQRRIQDLRDFEREYRARFRAYLVEQMSSLNGGDALTDDQRQRVEAARQNATALEGMWAVLPSVGHLLNLLDVIDSLAPKSGTEGEER